MRQEHGAGRAVGLQQALDLLLARRVAALDDHPRRGLEDGGIYVGQFVVGLEVAVHESQGDK